MLGYFKDAYNYVADKALDAKEAFEDMRLTRGEKMGVTAAAVSAWPLFSLTFGSAPLTLLTVVATPVATTALLAAGYGIGKGIQYFMDNNRWRSEFLPSFGPNTEEQQEEEDNEHELDSDAEDENDVDLNDGFEADAIAGSYTGRTLLHRGGQEVIYRLPAMNKAEADAFEYGASRSGYVRNRFGNN